MLHRDTEHARYGGWLTKAPILFVLLILALALCVLLFAATFSRANPPTDYPIDPRLHDWFEAQINPKKNNMSCCKEADGHVLRDDAWRQTATGYQFKTEDGAWHDVPDAAVLDNVPGGNPTGGAVVWYAVLERHETLTPERIYCFARPTET